MEKTGTLVALALTLCACGSVDGALDGGSDADTRDYGVVVYDMATPRDMGEPCVSEPCIQRSLIAGGVCVEDVRETFSCDPGPLAYDGRCNAVGECVGTPCECTADSGCCDGCHIIAEDEPCNDPPVEGPTVCSGNVLWEIRAHLCDGATTECGERYTVTGMGQNTCPAGRICNEGAPQGMRCVTP